MARTPSMLKHARMIGAFVVLSAAAPLMAAPPPKTPGPMYPPPTEDELRQERQTLTAWSGECGAGTFDLRKLFKDGKGPALRPATQSRFAEPNPDLLWYFVCSASASPSPEGDVCSFFRGLDQWFVNAYSDCRNRWSFFHFIETVGATPVDIKKACAELVGPDKDASSREFRHCEVVAAGLRGKQGHEAVCGKLQTLGLNEPGYECPSELDFLDGCPDGRCREAPVLVTALRSLDPRKCAASPLCSAFSRHRPQACLPFLAQANKMFCGKIAEILAEKPGKHRDEDTRKKDTEVAEQIRLKQAAETERMRKADEERLRKDEEQRRANAEYEKRRKEGEESRKNVFKKGAPMQSVPPDVLKKMNELEAARQSKEKQ